MVTKPDVGRMLARVLVKPCNQSIKLTKLLSRLYLVSSLKNLVMLISNGVK